MKDSFILYNSFYEPIKSLKNEQLGKLFRAVFNYTINGEITQDSEILVPFMFIKNQIDLDSKKWIEEKQKRSEAGKKGMQNRWHNKNNNNKNAITKDNSVINVITDYNKVYQGITKITDNVNDNVNVNDNDINNMIIIYNWEDNKQCECITKKNEVCNRRSSYNINGKNYCNQHSRPLIGNLLKEKKYFENEELNKLFLEYLDLRTKIKCKNTDRAINLLLNELNKYDDDIKIQMINNSIMNSWKSVYPVKNAKTNEIKPEWLDKKYVIERNEEAEDVERRFLESIEES